MWQNRKSTCPNCRKKAFHLTKDITSAICDKCGFKLDYEKIPFLKNVVDLLKQMKGASSFELDGKEMEEVK